MIITESNGELAQPVPIPQPNPAVATSAKSSHCPHCGKHMHTQDVIPNLRQQADGSLFAGAEDMLYVCGLCGNAHFIRDEMRHPVPASEWSEAVSK